MQAPDRHHTTASAPRRPRGPLPRLRGWVNAQLSQPLLRNAYALMAATGLTQLLGMVYWAVAARYYTEQHVGQGSAAISAMRLLSGFVALYLTGVLTRYVPLAGRRTNRLVSGIYLASIAGSVLISLVFLLEVDTWAPALGFLRDSVAAVTWFCVAVAAWSIFTLQDFVLAGLRRAVWVTAVTTVFSIAKLGLLVMLATPLPRDGIFLSWSISTLAALVPLNVLLYRRFMPSRTTGTGNTQEIPIRQIGTFAAAEYTTAISVLAAQMLPPVLIAAMFDATTTAYFYMPWLIGTALQLLPRHMATSLTVESCSNAAKLTEYARSATRRTALLLVPVIVVTAVFAEQLLLIFGGTYAAAGAPLLQLVTVALIPTAAVELYVGIARAQGRPGTIAAVQLSLSVLLLALSLAGASLWGITGVGVAVLVSYSMVTVAILPRMRTVLTARADQRAAADRPTEGGRP